MLNPPDAAAPRPLVVAAAVTILQAIVFVCLTIVQVVNFSSERAAMNWTTILGFLLWALMLGFCAWQVLRGRSWARSPIVMAELIHLGVALSFVRGSEVGRGDEVVAWFIAASAVVVLVGFFRRVSLEYLAAADA